MDPGAAFTAGKKIIDYTFQLISASAESREAATYLKQFERELDNLCKLKTFDMGTFLSKSQRMEVQRRICDARDAIACVAEPNRQSQGDVEKFETVTIYRRVLWTLRDNDAIKLYMPRVQISYASVLQEVGALQAVAREHHLDNPSTIDEEESSTSNNCSTPQASGVREAQNDIAGLGTLFLRNSHQHDVVSSRKLQRRRKFRFAVQPPKF